MRLVDCFEREPQKVGRWKVSLIDLFIPWSSSHSLVVSLFLLSLCRQAVVFLRSRLALPLFVSLLPCLSCCLSSVYSKAEIKPRARVHLDLLWHAIWYSERQPWATICATLCHRGIALGHRQWHTNHLSTHSSVHPSSYKRTEREESPKKARSSGLTHPRCYIKTQRYVILDMLRRLPFSVV